MTNQLLFGLLNFIGVVVLSTVIVRARKNKQLKFVLISGPTTKVEPITLRGRGLQIAIIGWVICVILFAFSGLLSLFTQANLETSYFITFISGFLAVTTLLIASWMNGR